MCNAGKPGRVELPGHLQVAADDSEIEKARAQLLQLTRHDHTTTLVTVLLNPGHYLHVYAHIQTHIPLFLSTLPTDQITTSTRLLSLNNNIKYIHTVNLLYTAHIWGLGLEIHFSLHIPSHTSNYCCTASDYQLQLHVHVHVSLLCMSQQLALQGR